MRRNVSAVPLACADRTWKHTVPGWRLVLALSYVWLTACTPALIAGGTAAGYYVGQDDRGVGVIVDDATITATVKARFVRDRKIDALKINVDTHEGIVTLYGSVPNMSMEDQAIRVASHVRGVKKIISKITVLPTS